MILPAILPRVKERYDDSGCRVRSLCRILFVLIAATTGQCQITEIICASLSTRLDMIHSKSPGVKFLGIAAVFTNVIGLLNNLLTHPLGDNSHKN